MGMNDNAINFLFAGRPKIKNVPKMRKFLRQGGHITLEKADNTNNTGWMNACASKGYLPAMIAHREGGRGVFRFDNFDKWLDTRIRMLWATKDGERIPVFAIETDWTCGEIQYWQYIKHTGIVLLEGWDELDSEAMCVEINTFGEEVAKDDTILE